MIRRDEPGEEIPVESVKLESRDLSPRPALHPCEVNEPEAVIQMCADFLVNGNPVGAMCSAKCKE